MQTETLNIVPESGRRKRRRAANGAGYIFRSGSYWYLRYRDWRVIDGQHQRVQLCRKIADVEPGYRSKKPPASVQEIAAQHLAPITASVKRPESTQLLTEFVETAFLPYIRQRVRASTFQGYSTRWRTLKPWCRDARGEALRLRDTETTDVERILDRIARERNLTVASLRDLRKLFTGVFKYAKKCKLITGSPVSDVTLPNARQGEDTHAYSLETLESMLSDLPEPARTAVAVAGFAGLGRSEIRGLRWEDFGTIEFHDGEKTQRMPALQISQAVWNGIVTEPKTKARKAPVPVISRLARILDAHRLRSGNPKSGPIFANGENKPACMNNMLNRQILPSLNRCMTCGKPETKSHKKTDHAFKRDARLPEWHGWHAFRRGLATNLHHLGVPDKVIQQILRHSTVAVTQACYIKTFTADAAAAMQRFEEQMPVGAAVQ